MHREWTWRDIVLVAILVIVALLLFGVQFSHN
jgi:hypothetical protein